MYRGCRNRPDEGMVSLVVISKELNRWKAVDITYSELENAIAAGEEVEYIEDMYDYLEKRLLREAS